MTAADEGLLRIAEEVADGKVPDWALAEADTESEQQRALVGKLRILSTAASVFRRDEAVEETATLSTDARVPSNVANAALPQPDVGRWKHLEIRQELGRGAFGVVYRAWDPLLEREVALKLLAGLAAQASEPRASRFLHEGRLLVRVRHPNVVTVHGVDSDAGAVGLWMDFIRGRTLSDLRREQGAFGSREAAVVGVDLCRALGAVHGAGLVHGDVKAQNVMREYGGRIVLMDFGAGSDLREPSGDARKLSGTPFYMAPELFRREAPTPRSDLYSLGVLLYHLTTGEYPVTGRSLAEIAEAHRAGSAKLLRDARPDLPESFLGVVERALSRSPEARFTSAGEMEVALLSAIGAEGRAAVAVQGPSRTTARRVGSTAALALAAVVLVTLAVVWQIGMRRGAAGGPYTVEASLYRIVDETRERLQPGDSISPGDRIALELEGSTALYVYVLNEDDRGETYVLFPLDGVAPGNPLPPRVTHRLPGLDESGDPLSWKVTTAGSRERFLLVASPQPLKELETELTALARPKRGEAVSYARLPGDAVRRLRAVGGLDTDPSAPLGSARPFDRVTNLLGAAEQVRGVWIRQIDLANPG